MKNLKNLMLVFIVLTVIAALIPTTLAIYVSERGILEGMCEGDEVVKFQIDVTGVPRPYGVKVMTDLRNPLLLPENLESESYNAEGNSLFINPPATEFSVTISGTTPPSYYREPFGTRNLIKLNNEEYLYYHVFIIDDEGITQEDFEKPKRVFKLEKPEFYREGETKIESIENEQLKAIALSLLEEGLFTDALNLTEVPTNFQPLEWYKTWWLWFIIGLAIGVLMFYCILKVTKTEEDEEGL
ncbi:MAG: hypothetical protein JW878_07685 [Methanomicrobia archaeon]|nr:hypothetical protein [Methanomicrobia archaeon]